MKNQKGFTIIELIVVIAIIAVLAGIVLVNVTKYIAKSRDAAIKEAMAQYAKYAAVYYEKNNGSFAGLSDDPTAQNINGYAVSNVKRGTQGNRAPFDDATRWCIINQLNAEIAAWCVDYKGNAKNIGDTGSCAPSGGGNGSCP